jgi:hypothetical protein
MLTPRQIHLCCLHRHAPWCSYGRIPAGTQSAYEFNT